MSKMDKQVLEIQDLERQHLSKVNRRLELLEELSKVEKEEAELFKQIATKKAMLRNSTAEQNQRAQSLRTSVDKKRAPALSAATRTFSVNFKNPQQVKNELEEEKQALDKAIQSKQPKKPSTKPKLLDAIEPEDLFLFSPKLLAIQSAKLYEVIPKLKCEEVKGKKPLALLDGPNMSSQNNFSSVSPPPAEAYNDFVCAKTISTYPISPTKEQREGDPICDRFSMTLWQNRALLTIADGCNWGSRPREAAVRACEGFGAYMMDDQVNFKEIKEAGSYLLKAVAAAHNRIIEGKEDVFEAGTTTLLGGLLVELKKNDDLPEIQWAFLCACIGDCKAFCWSPSNGKMVDITVGNRTNLTDAQDPGGRIGPYLQGGTPDLRNLDLYFHPCSKGDIILLVSDGVHDNLDPQQLGKTPKEFGIEAETWKEAEDFFPEETEDAKTNFRCKFLASELGDIAKKNKDFSLIDICQHIIQYCWYLTKKSREFMEQFPNKRQPVDYVQYPGKMDHTTVVALRVGMYM